MRASPEPSAPLYSLWLRPESSWGVELEATMNELSPYFKVPKFLPHTTVQGDLALPLEGIRAGILSGLKGMKALGLEIAAAEESEEFFRSLYLRFSPSRDFDQFQELSAASLGTRNGLSPFPHLSLSYGNLPSRERKRYLADRLSDRFSGRRMVFSSLALTLSASSLPIGLWEVIEEFRFESPARGCA